MSQGKGKFLNLNLAKLRKRLRAYPPARIKNKNRDKKQKWGRT